MLHAFRVQTQTDVEEPLPFKFENRQQITKLNFFFFAFCVFSFLSIIYFKVEEWGLTLDFALFTALPSNKG